jgi:hypothetical protein
MNETFNFDTDEYIVEPSRFSYNDLIKGGIRAACKAGRTPREM